MSLSVFLSFCFSSSKHNIVQLLKYTRVEFISIKLPWEDQIKLGKHKIILVFRKVTQLVVSDLGDRKKKEKNSKSKTTALAYFNNLKKKQQDQGGKNWCYTQKVLFQWQSQISELLRSILKILSFWNQFWIILCLLW